MIASAPLFSRAFSSADPSGPRLDFAETTFDFGEVYEGDLVIHHFAFRNTGTAQLRLDPIVVNAVKASCSLPNALTVSVPSFSDTDSVVVNPGATNEVITTLDTEGYAVPGFDGQFSQRIRIYSNDPDAPRTILHITGRIKPILMRDPVEIGAGALFKADGQLPSQLTPVHLIPTAGTFMEVTHVGSSSPFLKPSVARSPDDNGYLVTAAIDPSIPDGPFEDVYLTVYTTHPKKPKGVIRVSGQVYPEQMISESPAFMAFGLVRPGESVSATVMMEKPGAGNWRVLDTKTKAGGAAAKTWLRRLGTAYQLEVAIQAPAQPWASFGGEVELTTDTKLQPKIVIPFAGWTYDDAPFSQPADRLKTFLFEAFEHKLFDKPEDFVRKALAGGQDPRVLPMLIGIAREEGPLQGRIRAIDLLERYREPATIEALEGIVRSNTEELVRDEALDIYFRLARERSLPLLLEGLNDPSEWVRERAATLLGELGDVRAKAALLNASRDKKPDVALAAVEALEQFFEPPERKQD